MEADIKELSVDVRFEVKADYPRHSRCRLL